jgi:hypothetical protein
MTVLPPGLIDPPAHSGTVVQLRPPTSAESSSEPRWTVRSVVFVLLVAFTFLAFGLAIGDLLDR